VQNNNVKITAYTIMKIGRQIMKSPISEVSIIGGNLFSLSYYSKIGAKKSQRRNKPVFNAE
jgi:hypothetical protein